MDSFPPTQPLQLEGEWPETRSRGMQRYGLRRTLHVLDATSARLLGEVIDLSEGGLCLHAQQPVPPARRNHLLLSLRNSEGERFDIEVLARCAWHRARPESRFEVGFEFIQLDDYARERIRRMVDAFSV
jgi:PilZ domain